MIKQLIKLANHLDNKGFQKEADYLDRVISKYAGEGRINLETGEVEEIKHPLSESKFSTEQLGGQKLRELEETLLSLNKKDMLFLIESIITNTSSDYILEHIDKVTKLVQDEIGDYGKSTKISDDSEFQKMPEEELYGEVDEVPADEDIGWEGPFGRE